MQACILPVKDEQKQKSLQLLRSFSAVAGFHITLTLTLK